jgi:fumarate reductase subunit D
MESLFVRSLALGAAQDSQTIASASRTTADATFAVASGREGVIRVYAASCSALLHEFAAIHSRVYTLHYTSFSDSLVTLESDAAEEDDDDAETFLCVYHDWRERKMVRGYTLPLGVLESPSSRRKADCVAVCSFTGRVVVAMGTVLNIWQCSRGFFEHVMELKVDMAQRHAFLQVEYVAIHGVYVAFASQTEVRVMEIHVRSSKDADEAPKLDANLDKTTALEDFRAQQQDGHAVPEDSAHCVQITGLDDLDAFVEVPVSCSAYSTTEADTRREQDEQRIFDEQEQIPMVLGRNEAQQEVWNLAGLVRSQDIRTNQAMSYFVGESDVSVLLQRFLPPNHSVRSLRFLPETIDNRVCVETRSYTRLLVATEKHAFLYYFLSEEVDSTRTKMARKVLGKGERTRSRGMHKPIKVGKVVVGQSRDSFASVEEEDDEETEEADGATESGRVVMHYSFTSAVTSITANSSFLFVATLSGLQVWSIWSPCHYVAASRALSKSLVPQPSQPQLLCTQPIPYPASQLAALDSYVVLLPQVRSLARQNPSDLVHVASLAAAERLPEAEFEMRAPLDWEQDPSIMIFQQSPPSLVFSYVRQGVLSADGAMKPFQIDLLLSLFSLYRYRADVGFDLLRLAISNEAVRQEVAASISDRKERLALELETKLYDRLARECAADLAAVFMSEHHRNLERAALLFVASNVPSIEVLRRLQAIVGTVDRSEVIKATGKYLEAFVFPPPASLADVCAPQLAQDASLTDAKFTRTVLLHYGKYFPEQLSRLVVDASLKWTLGDIAFALEKLHESSSHSVLVKIATLVLVLRAAAFPGEAWDALAASADTAADAFAQQCSDASMLALLGDLLQSHVDALVHLTVTHPDLLVQEAAASEDEKRAPGFSRRLASSKLTKALLQEAPAKYLDILERLFNNAIGRQETIQATLLFCLSAIGEAAAPSAARIALSGSSSSDLADSPFVPDQALVLRFLVFVLQMFPTLERLSEKEEVHDDEEDLKSAKAAVAAELTRLCVKLSSCFHGSESNDRDGRVEATVCALFEPMLSDSAPHGLLPVWVRDYLDTRCLPEAPRLRRTLGFLFYQALGLLHEKDLIHPQDVLAVYEVLDAAEAPWKLENDLAAMAVLLTLPRLARYVPCCVSPIVRFSSTCGLLGLQDGGRLEAHREASRLRQLVPALRQELLRDVG